METCVCVCVFIQTKLLYKVADMGIIINAKYNLS